MNIEQAKQTDIVDYLASLGYKPARISNNDYWYLSPLRNEKTASFKVNRRKNVWYDHGIGKGGNFIGFGVLYHECPVSKLLEKLTANFSLHPPSLVPAPKKEVADPVIKITGERKLISLSLQRYLRQRRIDSDIASRYCREIIFSLSDKQHAAIGFKNNDGGYELRNGWFKGSSSPKAVTTIENSAKNLTVFEGFFNFLSYQTIHKNQSLINSNYLILNSASFFEKSKAFMERYQQVHLFMDRDSTGRRCTELALKWDTKYKDESHLYEGYNDLNEWMQHVGKKQSQSLRHNLK